MGHSQAQRRAQTVKGAPGLLKKPTPSQHHVAMSYLIDAHVAHLRASGYSPRTVGAREEVLRRIHNHLPFGLGFAATEELDEWLGQPSWSKWTRATYAMHVRAFYRWATTKGPLDGDPTADMAKPRHPRCNPNPVTEEELACALERSPEPWYTIVLIAAASGLRANEIAGLRREDITEEDIHVREGKGGNAEQVPCHPDVWAHIQDRPVGALIVHDGKAVNGRWISAHARHHFDSIGLPTVHLHRFRHYFATALLDQGHDIRTIQELMRHRSVTSTQIYTMVRSGKRRLAIRSLPLPTRYPLEH